MSDAVSWIDETSICLLAKSWEQGKVSITMDSRLLQWWKVPRSGNLLINRQSCLSPCGLGTSLSGIALGCLQGISIEVLMNRTDTYNSSYPMPWDLTSRYYLDNRKCQRILVPHDRSTSSPRMSTLKDMMPEARMV